MSTMSFITSIYQNKTIIYQTNDTSAEASIQKSIQTRMRQDSQNCIKQCNNSQHVFGLNEMISDDIYAF